MTIHFINATISIFGLLWVLSTCNSVYIVNNLSNWLILCKSTHDKPCYCDFKNFCIILRENWCKLTINKFNFNCTNSNWFMCTQWPPLPIIFLHPPLPLVLKNWPFSLHKHYWLWTSVPCKRGKSFFNDIDLDN